MKQGAQPEVDAVTVRIPMRLERWVMRASGRNVGRRA